MRQTDRYRRPCLPASWHSPWGNRLC